MEIYGDLDERVDKLAFLKYALEFGVKDCTRTSCGLCQEEV
jgi:hypothetical protein